jgi:hypothetical protein
MAWRRDLLKGYEETPTVFSRQTQTGKREVCDICDLSQLAVGNSQLQPGTGLSEAGYE